MQVLFTTDLPTPEIATVRSYNARAMTHLRIIIVAIVQNGQIPIGILHQLRVQPKENQKIANQSEDSSVNQDRHLPNASSHFPP
jgi:Icc-related predicted phosphoesterase